MLGFLGQFKKSEEPETESKNTSKNSEEFINKPKTQQFIRKWTDKRNSAGEPVYTKRGIISLLGALYGGSDDDDDDTLDKADDVLAKLGSMDGLNAFLAGWKASTEGLMKGIKESLGGK